MKEAIFFTIVDPVPENGENTQFDIVPVGKHFYVEVGGSSFNIDHQQMVELGTLLIGLANKKHVDFDSAVELLDGFEIKTTDLEQNLKSIFD